MKSIFIPYLFSVQKRDAIQLSKWFLSFHFIKYSNDVVIRESYSFWKVT